MRYSLSNGRCRACAIGHPTGVAKILGVKFSGFLAWWLWRIIYLSKLPRPEKKLRVAIAWTLDVLFPKDLVQFQTIHADTMSRHENDLHTVADPPAVV
jgi:hypothetical protein